jgi:hypothetical protein
VKMPLALRPQSRPSRQQRSGPLTPEHCQSMVPVARPRARERRLGNCGDARDYLVMECPWRSKVTLSQMR